MKKILYISCLYFLIIGCNNLKENSKDTIIETADTLNEEYLKTKTTYFEVKNDSIIGEGKQVLDMIFQESQFVVFGERHNSIETSKLTRSLIPVMTRNDFKTMCLEIGPHSASKLTELMKPHQSTVDNLKEFNTHYYNDAIDDLPIPFFSGIEDAMFLQSTSEHGFEIWGLDQEYYYSILYLTDELLEKINIILTTKNLKF